MILHSLRGGTLTSFWNYRSSVFRYRFELKIKNILVTKRNIGQHVLVVVTVIPQCKKNVRLLFRVQLKIFLKILTKIFVNVIVFCEHNPNSF